MKSSSFILLVLCFVIQGCGKNPSLQRKASKGGVVTVLAPQEAEQTKKNPNVILREKDSGKEGLIDFGKQMSGEKLVKFLELVNIGNDVANDLNIPLLVESFKIININCGSTLLSNEKCDLRIEIDVLSQDVEKSLFTINYDNVRKQHPPLVA